LAVELSLGLAAELRGGAGAGEALVAAACGLPGAESVVTAGPHAAALDALSDLARAPGGAGLSQLATVLRISERTGSGLAAPVARLAEALRDERQLRREVSAQLASPRATALLLSLLPGFGLLMGQALGARPVAVLLATTFGNLALGAGAVLVGLGLLWMRVITRRAEPP
jgi:tight adherence protein B